MRPLSSALGPILIAVLASSPAWAQDEPIAHKWSHGTTLSGSVGAATASSDTGALFGGSLGWEVTPRVGVDGTATWLNRQIGEDAFAASLTAHLTLTKSHSLSPFVEGGFGLYMATFDPKQVTSIPDFYAGRMSGTGTHTFTDPAFFLGGGVNVFTSRHVAIRPVAGAIIAMRNSQSYTTGTLAVRVEYHFEDHPLTPY